MEHNFFKCVLFKLCFLFNKKKQYKTLFPEKTILEIDVPKYILVNPHFLAINAIGLANQFRHRQISLAS